MKINIAHQLTQTPAYIMRKCGYHPAPSQVAQGEQSYARTFGAGGFPRFHAYTRDEPALTVSLHLDQKQTSYRGSRAHCGEHDTSAVLEEGERIKRWFAHFKAEGK